MNGLKLNVGDDVLQRPKGLKSASAETWVSGSDKVKTLFRVLTGAPYYSQSLSGVTRMLEVGCAMFGAEYGLLLRSLSSQVAEVAGVVDNGGGHFFLGQHLPIEDTSIAEVFGRNETYTSKSFPLTGVCSPGFSYNDLQVNAYLGTVVVPSSVDPMVVCFFSSESKEGGFTAEDTETIELLAEGVACMIDLQKAQAQRKMTDQAIFALGSVKTLEEYKLQAEIPVVYGVSSKVVDVLSNRVGCAPLSIGHIAEELNLSKRTLQRRLQQQGISFAELRDQLRFHHSIDYLVRQQLSIDSISSSLDFSDRTSFTNAFKRWTGLSPSTFRKLFRDYA